MHRPLLALVATSLLAGCPADPEVTDTPLDPTDVTGTTDLPTTGSTATTGDSGTTVAGTVAVSVSVTGLLGAGLVLQNNGADDLSVAADGTHAFATELAIGAPYDVTVVTDPLDPAQRCTVTDGMGKAAAGQPAIDVSCESYHVAFVTSTTGTGDLSSWADAGRATGAAAGDAICQAHADRAGLSGTFVAWLSDSTDDAYCRVAGASGAVADDCGAATKGALPTDGGPWVRTDGQPFASELPRMVDPVSEVWLPPQLDEVGAAVSGLGFFSGTTGVGTASRDEPCADWTSGASTGVQVTGGPTDGTDLSSWSGSNCETARRLLCLQSGAGIALPDPPAPPAGAHQVFLSSTTVRGSLGGLKGADALCARLAGAAGYTGTYEAWLSDGTTSAASRMAHLGPWVRPDGRVVADTTKEWLSGSMRATPNLTELGTFSHVSAWTGTDRHGAARADTCQDWTSDFKDEGGRGIPSSLGTPWTESGTWDCESRLHLYCYED